MDSPSRYRIYAELERRGLYTLARDYSKKNLLSPFTERIRNYVAPVGFKMFFKSTYDGKKDPDDHVFTFFHSMRIVGASDEMLCRAFPSTLCGIAHRWFHMLKPNSIDSFDELVKSLCIRFMGSYVTLDSEDERKYRIYAELEHGGSHTLARDYAKKNFLSPFTERIRNYVTPDGSQMTTKIAKMAAKITYDGESDPFDHMYGFLDPIRIVGAPDEMLCRALPSTLRGNARKWFSTLKPNSIDTLDELLERLYSHFIGRCKPCNALEGLGDFVQKRNESLRDYFQRFHTYAVGVDVEVLTAAATSFYLSRGTMSMMLISELVKTNTATAADVFCIARNVIDMEERMSAVGAAPLVVKRSSKGSRDERPKKRRKSYRGNKY